jgi:hypothetical protein
LTDNESLVLVLGLFLLFPLSCAGDSYNDELRLLDLELEMLSLRSQMLSLEREAINARSREADRERAQQNADLERDLSSYRERHSVSPSPVFELDHITVLDPEPLFPTMRPP